MKTGKASPFQVSYVYLYFYLYANYATVSIITIIS